MTKKKLTVKQKKFVKAKVEGKNNVQAFKEAGYAPTANSQVVRNESSKLANKPHIQQAIDDALMAHGATPEWAVVQLMKVAEQDKEVGAKRLASRDILELHGWNKNERPNIQISAKTAFFSNARDIEELPGEAIQ